ncbi:MAG: hypothetical protein JJE21_04270 [Spirochaetaceae bacterium]|nr:hypothetical protein [Spirochaetaceae bacterium]
MIGLTSITFRNKSIEEVIEFAKKAGVSAIEWGSDVHVPPGNVEVAKEVALKCINEKINICSYGSYYKLGQNQNFELFLNSAQALNTSRIRIWAGTKGSNEISSIERELLILESIDIASKAAKFNIEIGFEYHRNTLTDNKESALQLIKEVDLDNVFLYWQPNPDVTEKEKLDEIHLLNPYIKSVHFFNWSIGNTRHLMSEGIIEWSRYINAINKEIPYLLEFTLADNDDNALSDITTIKKLF